MGLYSFGLEARNFGFRKNLYMYYRAADLCAFIVAFSKAGILMACLKWRRNQ